MKNILVRIGSQAKLDLTRDARRGIERIGKVFKKVARLKPISAYHRDKIRGRAGGAFRARK